MSHFARLLRRLVKEFGGTKQDLAQAIGMRPPQFSRLLSDTTTPSIETCLWLAHVTDTAIGTVLRAAGRHDLAVVLEEHYGAQTRYRRRPSTAAKHMKPLEVRRLAQIRALDPKTRRAFTVLLNQAAPPLAPPVQAVIKRQRRASRSHVAA